MEDSSVQRDGGHPAIDCAASSGSLSELASTTLMPNMTTPAPSPRRGLERSFKADLHAAVDEKNQRSHSDPLGASSGGGRKGRDAAFGESFLCGVYVFVRFLLPQRNWLDCLHYRTVVVVLVYTINW